MDTRFEEAFVMAAGSVVGSAHRTVLRNNQDAFAMHATSDAYVVVVTDGCSQGRASEVGAKLGAAWLSRALPKLARDVPDPATLAQAASTGLLTYLGEVARGIADPETFASTVHEHLLFTFLAAIVRQEDAVVFGIGDGVFAIDGDVVALDPGPENAPPYVAYGLLGTAVAPRLHLACSTRAMTSLLVATDGALDVIEHSEKPVSDGTIQGGLDRFGSDPRYAANPSLLQKRLVVLGDRQGRLHDDTTVAVIRRKEASPWTSS